MSQSMNMWMSALWKKRLLLDYWKTPQPHFEGQMTLSMVESHLWELVPNCQTRTYTINNNGTLPWLPTLLTANICNLWNSFPWRRRKMPTDCTMNQIKGDGIMATSFLVQNEEFRAQHFDLKEFAICRNTWNCRDCAKETTQNVKPNGQQSFLEESCTLRIAKFCCIVIWSSHHHKSSDYWRRAKNFNGGPQLKKPNPNLMFKR